MVWGGGGGGASNNTETEIVYCGIACRGEFYRSSGGVGGPNGTTDVRWERIPLLRSTALETALAKGFSSGMRDMKHTCVCRRRKLPGRGAHSEKVREGDMR